jgi:phosphonate transport system substrate-binding protein
MLKILSLLQLCLFLFFSFLSLASHAAEQEPQVCRFGIPPFQKGRTFNEVRKTYQPMLDWLTEQTGCQFVAVGGSDYDDLIEKIVTGKVHLAELGPVPYIVATQKNPEIRLLLTTLTWNTEKTELIDSYQGHIVTLRKNKAINSLEDLEGKPFAFVDLESTSGYVYPSALLREKEIDHTTFFSKTHFLGSHPNVTDAIVAESVSAGATWQYNLVQAIKKHGDVFKILVTTPPIPNNCIAIHPSLPESLQTKVKQLLPTIDPILLENVNMKGFVVRPDSFYDTVRKVVAQEKVGK